MDYSGVHNGLQWSTQWITVEYITVEYTIDYSGVHNRLQWSTQ